MNIINTAVPYPYSSLDDYEGKYNLKDIHNELLDVLLAFDAFCRKHDIKYSLADGTLLGALRHGDFIPWDDDADVMVTREEYKKIREAIQEDKSIHLIKIHFLDRVTTDKSEKNKIYIDLFINEDMPASKIFFAWKKFKTGLLRTYFKNDKVRNVRHDQFSVLRKFIYGIVVDILHLIAILVVGKRDVFDLNDKTVAIKNHKPSGIYTRYTSRMYETKRRFNKESYNAGYAEVEFRGQHLMAIENADVFLKEMYGDYMKLLPEEKRKPEHPVNMLDSSERCIKRYS